MLEFARKKFDQNPVLADLFNAVFFGVLSIVFGYVKIRIPEFDGISADFREIPLLVSVFYLRFWWPLMIMCGITIFTPSSVHPFTVYFMHLIGLMFGWLIYTRALVYVKLELTRALLWPVICAIYYLVFIIPLLVWLSFWLGPQEGLDFVTYYTTVMGLVKYEFIVTTLVTTMYLVQHDTRKKLLDHEKTLEIQIEDRTNKLASANYKLQMMNENLDEMVIRRSEKIKEQLNAIEKYVNMNSHQLRAPLSNILGLVELLKSRLAESGDQALIIESLEREAAKLDDIVKEMNELLEKEMTFHSHGLEE